MVIDELLRQQPIVQPPVTGALSMGALDDAAQKRSRLPSAENTSAFWQRQVRDTKVAGDVFTVTRSSGQRACFDIRRRKAEVVAPRCTAADCDAPVP